MVAVYGTLSRFNPDYTEVVISRKNDITDDKKKQAILLASVEDKTYALIKSPVSREIKSLMT